MWDTLARRTWFIVTILLLLTSWHRPVAAQEYTNTTPNPAATDWTDLTNWLLGLKPPAGGSTTTQIILQGPSSNVHLNELGTFTLNHPNLNNTLPNNFKFDSTGSGYKLEFGGANPILEAQVPAITPQDLQIALDIVVNNQITGSTTVALTPNQNRLAFTGIITGSKGFDISGPGSVSFSHPQSTFSGGVHVASNATLIAAGDSINASTGPLGGGMVTLEDNATLGTLHDGLLHSINNPIQAKGDINFNNATLDQMRILTLSLAHPFDPSYVENINVQGNLTVQNTLSGVAFNKIGPGTFFMQNSSPAYNTQSVPITISQGALVIGSSNNLGAAANPVKLNGGILRNGATLILGHDLLIGPAGGTIDAAYATGINRDLTVNVLSGTGTLDKTGGADLILGNTSTFSGFIHLLNGALRPNAANGLGGGKFVGDAGTQLVLSGNFPMPSQLPVNLFPAPEGHGTILLPPSAIPGQLADALNSGYYIGASSPTPFNGILPVPTGNVLRIARNIDFNTTNALPANTKLHVGSMRNGIGAFTSGGGSGGGFIGLHAPNDTFNGMTDVAPDYTIALYDSAALGSSNAAICLAGINAWNTDPLATAATRQLYSTLEFDGPTILTANILSRLRLRPGSDLSFINVPTIIADRIPNAITLPLNGTGISLIGGFTPVSESAGPITFDGPSGVYVSPVGSTVTLSVSTLTRVNRGLLATQQSGSALLMVTDLPNSPAMQTASGLLLPFISAGNAAAARYSPATGFTAVTAATPGVITSLASPAPTDFAVISSLQTVNSSIQLSRLQFSGSSYDISGTGAITLADGANPIGINSNATAVNLNNDLNIFPAAELIITTAGNLQFKGKLTATNGLTLGGQGVATLSGANNDITGPITLQSGMLKLMTPLGHSNPLVISNMAILNLQTDQSFNALSGGGTIGNSGSTLSTFTLNNTTDQTFDGSFIANIGLTKTGTGTLTLTGISKLQGPTTINGGTLIFTPSEHASSGLNINGGTVQLAGVGDTFKTPLHILSSAGVWIGKLDIKADNMIIGATSGGSDIPSQIRQGSNLGAWNGAGGITSSTAQASVGTATRLSLGYATGSEFTAANGQTLFNGVPFLSTDTLVFLTLAGDANMDRSVTFADFLPLQNHYNQPGTNWVAGDFNGDGSTTFADFLTLQNNYNKVYAAGPLTPATSSSVPEPSSLLLLTLPLILLRKSRYPLWHSRPRL